MFDFSHFTQILLKSSIFLDKTMKVDGHISGTAGQILLIFGQIGANNVNFSKSHMRAGTRYFLLVSDSRRANLRLWDPFGSHFW